jgi:hypothetical protein
MGTVAIRVTVQEFALTLPMSRTPPAANPAPMIRAVRGSPTTHGKNWSVAPAPRISAAATTKDPTAVAETAASRTTALESAR